MSLAAQLKQACFQLSYKEVPLDQRGIVCDPAIKPRLEHILTRFLDGYNLALKSRTQAELVEWLDTTIEPAFQGFAYEGAAMFLGIMDYITPWQRNRVDQFLLAHGPSHDYIICVGIGFAVARIPWAKHRAVHYALRYPPGFAGLVLDGYGFHEGFFHSDRIIARRERPRSIRGYPARCFDNGIGRALWFVQGASPERIRQAIQRFPEQRQADLWAGIGLACAYAGSAYPDLQQYAAALRQIMEYAKPYRSYLELGVVCAAGTRLKANNPTEWTACACETILNMPLADAGWIVNDTWARVGEELKGRPRQEIGFLMHQIVNQRIIEQLEARSQPPSADIDDRGSAVRMPSLHEYISEQLEPNR